MPSLKCVFAGHAWSEWKLYPQMIGARVEWLRWESRCMKCREARQRWFRVVVPRDRRLPSGIKEAVRVEKYLRRIGGDVPRPETLQDGPMPPEVAASLGE